MIKRTYWPAIFFFIFCYSYKPVLSQTEYTIQGKVIDQVTKEVVKNVSVIIKETKGGTASNDSGYFKLLVRLPKLTLQFTAIGYQNATKAIDLTKKIEPLIIDLEKRADETLDEVVVNATKERSKVNSVEMNVTRINPELIKRSPLVLGEADIIKALTLQPGITTAGEGAGGFNVRGGNADQNLVLIDGAPIFNTSHLLGFFSALSPDAIEDVTLYKGAMPAQYGGRLSSLLNIKVKSGNTQKVNYTTGLSPVSARFFINGPLIKNKLTFTVGGRAAYPDLILNQLPGNFGSSRAFFYDGIIKGEYSFNDKNKIALTAYRSYDKFKFDTATSYQWTSNHLSFNYISAISSRISLRANANYSKFVSAINNLPVDYANKLTSSIEQKQGKISLFYSIAANNKVEVGADYVMYSISPGERKPASNSSNINALSIQREKGRELAGFISDEINLTDNITLQAGVRYTSYDYLGAKVVYKYQENLPLSKETLIDSVSYPANRSIQNYSGLEPRASLKIGITNNTSLKFSYNRGQQFLHLISNTTAISPVDYWKLSDNYIKGQRGDQYAVGYFQNFKNNQYELSMEAYYRTIKNMVDYKDGASLLLNQYIESELLAARGRNYGIELSFAKNMGKLTGQINYSYSKSQVQILNRFPAEQVNNGSYYPSNADRPHNLAIISKLKLGKGWSFNTNFVFSSGRTATFPDGNYAYNGTIVTNYSKRNMDRLPSYHRLDASFSYVSRRYSQQKKYSILNFSFYNLYLHKNAYSIYFQRSDEVLFSYRLSVVGTIIPSVSWTYNF